MQLPFGFNIRSLIAGMLLAWFVVPWVSSLTHRAKPVTS